MAIVLFVLVWQRWVVGSSLAAVTFFRGLQSSPFTHVASDLLLGLIPPPSLWCYPDQDIENFGGPLRGLHPWLSWIGVSKKCQPVRIMEPSVLCIFTGFALKSGPLSPFRVHFCVRCGVDITLIVLPVEVRPSFPCRWPCHLVKTNQLRKTALFLVLVHCIIRLS